MRIKQILLIGIGLFCFSLNALSQELDDPKKKILRHYDQAMQYKAISLFGEAIGELDKIIKIAKENNYQEEYIEASIDKSELFRITENFDRGVELLYQLKDTEKYPQLHVKKLGRLAALYAENGAMPKEEQRDSVLHLVSKGIEISTRLQLKEEEASLRNELGFSQNRSREFDIALKNLNRARELYAELEDRQNEIGVEINILDLHVSMSNFNKADSIYPDLLEKTKNTDWYAMKSKLCAIISMRYKSVNDILKELQWADSSHAYTVAHAKLMNTNQMATFRVVYDTEKFKEEAFQKSIDLQEQKDKTRQLILFISVLILAVAIVTLIFFREKRLKRKLHDSVTELNLMNDKYQMLIVESNHRIKNNLQMIISMLEFTKKGMGNSATDAVKSMSGKIQTISALHKYLYVDVHNEFVDLDTYFTEILKHYSNIGLKHSIDKSIDKVEVRSERIVYFGLILNEMLSNTLEHSNSKGSTIQLIIEKQGDLYLFSYSDNSRHEKNKKEGTGTMLIEQLVKRIKGIDYTLVSENGTYLFKFGA